MSRKQRRQLERRQRKHAAANGPTIRADLTESVTKHATLMVAENRPWTPFRRCAEADRGGAQRWENSRYTVALYPPQATDTPTGWPAIVHLSFKHNANVAITDFRDMQRIKSEMVHPEAMAVQVFPAESQLVDMANQYHLWVMVPESWPDVPEGFEWGSAWLPFGFMDGRLVSEKAPPGGRQREFEEDQKPTKEDEDRVAEVLDRSNIKRPPDYGSPPE
jgi:hypothetical protein